MVCYTCACVMSGCVSVLFRLALIHSARTLETSLWEGIGARMTRYQGRAGVLGHIGGIGACGGLCDVGEGGVRA